MAEIRKHDPEAGDGIARLVREALGETIRPVEPGERPSPNPTPASASSPAEASSDDEATLASIPVWDESGPMYNF